jgi:hypothetical protein
MKLLADVAVNDLDYDPELAIDWHRLERWGERP